MIIPLGPYQLHLDALFARILYRWRGRTLLALILVCGGGGLLSETIPPFWRGPAALTVAAPAGATVTVDGRPWPGALYAGAHRVVASVGARGSWADITLSRDAALTLTLPPGLAVTERALPAAAPGMQLAHVWAADGGWRLRSTTATQPTPVAGQTRPATPPQTVQLRDGRTERLALLDAYGGLADTVTISGTTIEAVVTVSRQRMSMADPAATLTVRGWAPDRSLPLTDTVNLVQFAPDGQSLLLGSPTAEGTQLSVVRPLHQGATPLIAVPGSVARITWAADGQVFTVASNVENRLTLTLVRLAPSTAATVIAELDATRVPDGIVPQTFTADSIEWLVSDSGGTTRWRARRDDLLPEPLGQLDACAITALPDDTLRIARVVGSTVVIGRIREQQFIGEAVLNAIPGTADLAGIWAGQTLLLRSPRGAWLVTLNEE